MSYPSYIRTADQRMAVDTLRGMLAPGDTVRTIVRHVTRSGMSRDISAYVMSGGELVCIDWLIKRTKLFPGSQTHEGVRVGGCGMDMTFHLVYSLSRMLYPHGAPCTGSNGYDTPGKRCHSNDHSNGDRDYTPGKIHTDGGYALYRVSL